MKIILFLLVSSIRGSKKLPKPGFKKFGAENIRYDAKNDGMSENVCFILFKLDNLILFLKMNFLLIVIFNHDGNHRRDNL